MEVSFGNFYNEPTPFRKSEKRFLSAKGFVIIDTGLPLMPHPTDISTIISIIYCQSLQYVIVVKLKYENSTTFNSIYHKTTEAIDSIWCFRLLWNKYIFPDYHTCLISLYLEISLRGLQRHSITIVIVVLHSAKLLGIEPFT